MGHQQSGGDPWRLSTAVLAEVDDPNRILGAVGSGFQAWAQVEDANIEFGFEGPTAQREPALDGINTVTFGSTLPLPTGVLAVTFPFSLTGRIVDADIVFNSRVEFSTNGDPGLFDVQAVTTHEVGHLLGLEHSGIVRATMAPLAFRGDLGARTLTSDDQIGARTNYPTAAFRAKTGTIDGFVRRFETAQAAFLAHVVVVNEDDQVVAGALTKTDGSYRIAGLLPGEYTVYAEPLDGPFVPGNFPSLAFGFGALEPNTRFFTAFH